MLTYDDFSPKKCPIYLYDNLIREINDIVIPFNNIIASNTWTSKQFNLAKPYGYLTIEIKISCGQNFGGLGCNYCLQHYYTSLCNKYCRPVVGYYTCNKKGDKICAEHKTGEKCDTCGVGWAGQQCHECAENYYPDNVCNVRCVPVNGKYSCSSEGKKVCHENWTGKDCDICAEHRTGESCEQCIEGWGGEKCLQCAENYYPDDVCNVRCIPVNGKYSCSSEGKKVCHENWKGAECANCSGGYFGVDCTVFCTPTEHFNCSVAGNKICLHNTTNVENSCTQKSPRNVFVVVAIGGTVIALISLALTLLKVVIGKNRKFKEIEQISKTATQTTIEAAKKNKKENKQREDHTYADVIIEVPGPRECEQIGAEDHPYAETYFCAEKRGKS